MPELTVPDRACLIVVDDDRQHFRSCAIAQALRNGSKFGWDIPIWWELSAHPLVGIRVKVAAKRS